MKLENFVLNNPYDTERDYFTSIARRSISYFDNLEEIFFRKLYQEANHKFFEKN